MARKIGIDYILDENRQPIKVEGSVALFWWTKHPDAGKVGEATVGSSRIITSFRGQQLGRNEPPHCFDTQIFSAFFDRHGETYVSWEAAVAGHARWGAAGQAAEDA